MTDEGEWGLVADLNYDPQTGIITRKDGRRVLDASDRGYKKGIIGGRNFYAHRVAWFLFHGRKPEHEIDHINGDRSDNRIVNLRDVPKEINNRNKAKSRRALSGVTGVYKANKPSCWVPQVSIGNKSVSLGATACLGIAIRRRRDAELRLGFHMNHGRLANG